MPNLTGTEIANRVKRQFGDEAGAQITDAMILDWINDGQREIVNRSRELYQIRQTANSTAGQHEYDLPTVATEIVRIHRVFYKGQPIDPISIQQAEEIYPEKDVLPRPSGYPTHCWIWGDKIYFDTATDSTGAHLTIYYQRYPTNLATIGDALTIPQRYQLKVKDYCIAQAAQLDDDDDRHAMLTATFNADVDTMQSDSFDPQQDVYPFVTVSVEDQWYGYY